MSIIARALGDTPAPAPQRRRLTPLVQAAPTHEPVLALADVPRVIEERVSAYLADPAPGKALVLALPAGSGKTTAMVRMAERVALAGQRVMYCGPRHDFFTDILAVPGVHAALWYEWLPRTEATEQSEGTCRYATQINLWMQRGYEARAFCHNRHICGFPYAETQSLPRAKGPARADHLCAASARRPSAPADGAMPPADWRRVAALRLP